MKTEFYGLLFILAFFLNSCIEDITPTIPNEEELITTLTYELTPINGGEVVVLKFQDLDGDGGENPTITVDPLQANTQYTGALLLENELYNPPLNISEEVEEEGVDHQFFFESTNSEDSFTYQDQDSDGNPIGLESTFTTGNSGTRTFTIILRHEPDKFAAGVSSGNIENAGGETDIQVNFEIDVE